MRKDRSWYLVWQAGTQSSSRTRVLASGICKITIAPGSWDTGALAAAVALVSEL